MDQRRRTPLAPSRTRTGIAGLTAAALGLAAYTAGDCPTAEAAVAPSDAALRPARSCRAVRERVIDLAVDQLLSQYRHWAPYYYRYHRRYPHRYQRMPRPATRSLSRAAAGGARAIDQAMPASEASTAKRSDDRAGPRHFTRTNVQERGVDEADLVKTDGRYVYTVRGGELLILRSWPATATAIVARLKIGGSATKLFLKGDRLAVFSSASRRVAAIARPQPRRHHRRWHHHRRLGYRHVRPAPRLPHASRIASTRISLIDVSRRDQPRIVRRLELDGRLQQALMIGSEIYLVSTGQLQLPPDTWQRVRIPASRWPTGPHGGSMSERQWQTNRPWIRAELRRRLARQLRRVAFASTLPRRHVINAAGQPAGSAPLFRCSDLYLPGRGGQLGLLSVSQINIDRPTGLRSTGLVARGWRVYASTGNLYLATANRAPRRWRRTAGSQQPIEPGTQLHKIVLQGAQGAPEYVASGTVPGQLLNQFSMSEHQGHLRVATTDANWRSRQGGNNLFVLREEGGRLKTVGALRGLAKGERIYAARMFGDKGYLVTFRRTDPLYTLDLSSPHAPRVVGELKVNGFSSYIHPLGNDHLLTIGQDADSSGRVLGMHLQIFDVSDFEQPRRSHHYRFNQGGRYAHSAAQSNHHAFTYDPRRRVLAIPLRYQNHAAREAFNGLLLLQIGAKAGFAELARISHADLYLDRLTRGCRGAACDRYRQGAYAYQASYQAPILRSIVIDDHILSLSAYGLKVNRLAKTSLTVASVPFQ